MPRDTPEHGLPGLVNGIYDFSARLRQLGDQAIAGGIPQSGHSYVDFHPGSYEADTERARWIGGKGACYAGATAS